ncbi:MAG: CHAT domain-containing protein, partial [Saprospiraceae bacterium]
AEAKNIYEKAIQVQYELYQHTLQKATLERIFDLIESAKSVILLDALAENIARQQTNIPTEILTRERQLNADIQQLKADNQQENIDLNQLIQKELALKTLVDSLKNNYPDYYNLKYQTQTVSLNDLSIEPNRSVLQYFVGSEYLYLLAINKNESQLVRTKLDFSLPDLVEQLQAGLLNYHLSGKRSDAFYEATADTLVNTAYSLHQKLIEPLLQTNFQLQSKLLIISDDVLGYVPFEILLTDLPKRPTAYGSHNYLIKNHQISYTYSATLLHEMQRQQRRAEHNFLAFAPAFPTTNAALADRSVATRSGLNPLIYNTEEVNSLQQLLGGETYQNTEATKDNFIEQAANYRILHLATHGKADDISGDNAYLVFYPQDEEKDYLLTNQELYLLDLQADMVVLSACETGIGELQNGEGIISLARGFSYAGAKSIVPTLWSINDQMTIELMTSFYENLQSGQTKDAALHQAKLAYLAAHPHEEVHPFFWAAFIVVGDTEALEIGGGFSWWWGLGVLLAVGIVVFFIIRKEIS